MRGMKAHGMKVRGMETRGNESARHGDARPPRRAEKKKTPCLVLNEAGGL